MSITGFPRLTPLLAAVLLAGPPAAEGQSDKGAFIVRLGDDTLAVERYTRTSAKLESDIVLQVPNARQVHYVATLGPSGTVSSFELRMKPLVPGPAVPKPVHGVIAFQGDTADVSITIGDSVKQLKIAAKPGAVPLASFSHALVEQAIIQSRKAKQDSVAFDWVALGAADAFPSYVVRRGADSVTVGFFGDPSYVRIDRAGRILGLDGRATTQKVLVDRVKDVNVERFAQAFTQKESSAGRPAGQLSPRDTARAQIGAARLEVDYGRPQKRGREIFGKVVPWNQVWRTGANAATQFSTDAALVCGTDTIPAGKYTLWTLPAQRGTKLIVNQQTGQWGTDYDGSQDLVRIDLRRESLPAPVERFTIAVEPSGNGGVLRLSWDTTSFALPFTVAQ
ncbi:MAG: DUF2911 domain-containing protein [Gemmatimonadales bacterium]